MKLILAQGNPGAQYTGTRHNIGWSLLDQLFPDATFHPRSKFFADVAEVTIAGEKVLLVKPTTFYNETGRTARALVDFYKLDPATNVLVIHDDLSLPFGTIRVRDKGSDAGNNGIKSLTAHIGPEYWRIRIGIGDERREQTSDADFVLSRLSVAAIGHLHEKIIPVVTEMIAKFCDSTLLATSQQIDTIVP